MKNQGENGTVPLQPWPFMLSSNLVTVSVTPKQPTSFYHRFAPNQWLHSAAVLPAAQSRLRCLANFMAE
jgi:hypothetical protein